MLETGCLVVDTLRCSKTLLPNVIIWSFCFLKTKSTEKKFSNRKKINSIIALTIIVVCKYFWIQDKGLITWTFNYGKPNRKIPPFIVACHNIFPSLLIFSINTSFGHVVASRGLFLVFSCGIELFNVLDEYRFDRSLGNIFYSSQAPIQLWIIPWTFITFERQTAVTRCNNKLEVVVELPKPSWVKSVLHGSPLFFKMHKSRSW